jgi:hypothetical protein
MCFFTKQSSGKIIRQDGSKKSVRGRIDIIAIIKRAREIKMLWKRANRVQRDLGGESTRLYVETGSVTKGNSGFDECFVLVLVLDDMDLSQTKGGVCVACRDAWAMTPSRSALANATIFLSF